MNRWPFVSSRRRRYLSATRSAPKATSLTSLKPSARSMPTSCPSPHSVNSAGKLGATIAATGAPPARSSRTRAAALWTCLACWLHTRTQLPQPMHRSGMTSAWPVAIRMALAGHSRTHV